MDKRDLLCINSAHIKGLTIGKIYTPLNVYDDKVVVKNDFGDSDTTYRLSRFRPLSTKYKINSIHAMKFGNGNPMQCEIMNIGSNEDGIFYTIDPKNGLGFTISVNEKDMDKFIMKSEYKYAVGDIIDISYTGTCDYVPDRIWIIKHTNLEENPAYIVHSERHGRDITIAEDAIKPCHKRAPVYSVPLIKKMYWDGFRFCGNKHTSQMREEVEIKYRISNVESVVATQAYEPRGGRSNSSTFGLWVRYYNPIQNPREQ